MKHLYRLSGPKGFTFLEIIMAVCVLALFLAVIMPSVFKTVDDNKKLTCEQNIQKIFQAKSMWAVENNKNAEDTVALSALVPDYISERPVCPSNGRYSTEAYQGERVDAYPSCSAHSMEESVGVPSPGPDVN